VFGQGVVESVASLNDLLLEADAHTDPSLQLAYLELHLDVAVEAVLGLKDGESLDAAVVGLLSGKVAVYCDG
jgi:hypothetical protein